MVTHMLTRRQLPHWSGHGRRIDRTIVIDPLALLEYSLQQPGICMTSSTQPCWFLVMRLIISSGWKLPLVTAIQELSLARNLAAVMQVVH
jgi:hypothetical protein